MASEGRAASSAIEATAIELEQALKEVPYQFSFYEALRRLECAYSGKPRLGQSRRPVEDAVRLTQEPSLKFASSTLADFTRGEQGGAARLKVNFFGMFGPNGPLPLHLTEYAQERIKHSNDPTFSRFLDLFHHRFLSLFYRAWANAQPAISLDRPQEDRFSAYIGSLFGVGMPSCTDRDAMPDLAKLHFAGRLSSQNKNAEGLIAMIEDFFKVPASLDQFIGEWLELPDDCRCRLGGNSEAVVLGVSSTIGAKVWECQQKFRIVLGPVGYADYERLLPSGESQACLAAIVRNYVGDSMSWDVQLILEAQERPSLELGKNGHLGWTTWLGERSSESVAVDLILSPVRATQVI